MGSLFHSACISGDLKKVEEFLALAREGNDLVNEELEDGTTGLHLAIRNQNSDVALALLAPGSGFNAVNSKKFRHTPLHLAAKQGMRDVVAALIAPDSGFEAVNAEDNHGSTALHWAAMMDRDEVASILLAPDSRFSAASACDADGCTALHLSLMRCADKVAELLLSPSSSFTAINAADYCGRTALHYAISFQAVSIVKMLTKDSRFNAFDAQDSDGNTAWHLAVEHNSTDIMQVLLEVGASQRILQIPSLDGMTCLQLAGELGNVDVAKLIFEYLHPSMNALNECSIRRAYLTDASSWIELLESISLKVLTDMHNAKWRDESALTCRDSASSEDEKTAAENKVAEEVVEEIMEENFAGGEQKSGYKAGSKKENTAQDVVVGETCAAQDAAQKTSVEESEGVASGAVALFTDEKEQRIFQERKEEAISAIFSAPDENGDTWLHQLCKERPGYQLIDIDEDTVLRNMLLAIGANHARDLIMMRGSNANFAITTAARKLAALNLCSRQLGAVSSRDRVEMIRSRNSNGESVLHAAAEGGSEGVAVLLCRSLYSSFIECFGIAGKDDDDDDERERKNSRVEREALRALREVANDYNHNGMTPLHRQIMGRRRENSPLASVCRAQGCREMLSIAINRGGTFVLTKDISKVEEMGEAAEEDDIKILGKRLRSTAPTSSSSPFDSIRDLEYIFDPNKGCAKRCSSYF